MTDFSSRALDLEPPASGVDAVLQRAVGAAPADDTMASRAERWGVLPTVRHWLEQRGVPLSDGWQAGYRRHSVRMMVLRRRLAEVLKVCDRIPVVVLKGEALGAELFGDPDRRTTTDIDLLVDPRDVDQVLAQVGALGFEPRNAQPMKPWAFNQTSWVDGQGILLEVHWRLALPRIPSPPTADVLARRRSVALGSLEVPVLSPRDQLFELAYHFQQHRGALKTVIDMAAWCDVYGDSVDWQGVRGDARVLGVANVLDWALQTVSRTQVIRRPWIGRRAPLVRYWAQHTSRAVRGCLGQPRTARLELVKPLRGPIDQARELGLLAASMLTLDSTFDGARSALATAVLGPHRVGVALARVLGLPTHPRQTVR